MAAKTALDRDPAVPATAHEPGAHCTLAPTTLPRRGHPLPRAFARVRPALGRSLLTSPTCTLTLVSKGCKVMCTVRLKLTIDARMMPWFTRRLQLMRQMRWSPHPGDNFPQLSLRTGSSTLWGRLRPPLWRRTQSLTGAAHSRRRFKPHGSRGPPSRSGNSHSRHPHCLCLVTYRKSCIFLATCRQISLAIFWFQQNVLSWGRFRACMSTAKATGSNGLKT